MYHVLMGTAFIQLAHDTLHRYSTCKAWSKSAPGTSGDQRLQTVPTGSEYMTIVMCNE